MLNYNLDRVGGNNPSKQNLHRQKQFNRNHQLVGVSKEHIKTYIEN